MLYLNVKLVPFFAFVLEGRSISKATWISAFLAFAGTVLLSSDGTPPNVGDLWSVLAAATSAMFILRLEKYSGSCDASGLNSANLWITAGLCAVWAGGWFHCGADLFHDKSVCSTPGWFCVLYCCVLMSNLAPDRRNPVCNASSFVDVVVSIVVELIVLQL